MIGIDHVLSDDDWKGIAGMILLKVDTTPQGNVRYAIW